MWCRLLLERRPRCFQLPPQLTNPSGSNIMLASDLARRETQRQVCGDLLHPLRQRGEPGTDIQLRSNLVTNRGSLVSDHFIEPVAGKSLDLDMMAQLPVPT